MHLSESDPSVRTTLMNHSKEKIKDDVIDKTVPASSVGLLEDTVHALPTLRKSMYRV